MDGKTTTRTRLSVAVCAIGILSFGATAAFAGEVTGNGKQINVKGQSACAFSGQEDEQYWIDEDPMDPVAEGDFVRGEPGHAQSWGQIPKGGLFGRDFLSTIGLHPGQSCNPTTESSEPS